MLLAFSVANRSSTAGRKVDRVVPADKAAREALLRVRRVVPAGSRIRALRGNSPEVRGLSILRVPALPDRARVAQAAQALVLDLVRAPASEHRAPADLVQVRVDRHLRAKLRALRVLPVRREAVAVSSIPRPKKAR
jgi:hypothetical protein